MLALSRCTLLAAAPWAAPAVTFGVPSLVGSSNSSQPDGSDFWFPSITIPTGIRGHVAQHITLSGDGGTCPPPSHPNQSCEQTMLSTDGGLTYKVTKQIQTGTSGNFNGYGDLGSWVPPKKGSKSTPGEFQAIVGCNDCFFGIGGGSLTRPTYLQTWLDDGTTLKLTGNTSIAYKGTPAAFTGDRLQGRACGAPPGKPCGMSTPDQSIIRTKDGGLLMAMYGHAADGYMNGSLYTTAFYSSTDGRVWNYASRMDVTAAMLVGKGAGEGPCEPSMVTLADGRVLAAFRLEGGHPLWLSWSSDNGKSWTDPRPATGRQAPGSPGSATIPYAVWPQLLLTTNGVLLLASGRPGIGFWVSPSGDGSGDWVGHDVQAEHSKNFPSDPWGHSGTTSYTGIAEVEPGVVLLAYDKTSGSGRSGEIQKVYSVRIKVAA